MRVDIFARVDAAREVLGFTPELRLEGPIDSVVPETTADHLLATLHEALSNVAQHAGASKVDVAVEAGRELLLRVADDGTGLPDRIEPGVAEEAAVLDRHPGRVARAARLISRRVFLGVVTEGWS